MYPQIEYTVLKNNIENNNINFYNIYNLDQDLVTYYTSQYYINNQTDTIQKEQKLKILFIDIEVFHRDKNIKFDILGENVGKAYHPISAITFYYDKQYYSYLLKIPEIKSIRPADELKKYFNDKLKEKIDDSHGGQSSYIDIDDELNVFIYENEIDLILDCWKKIRELDPHILSGFNSHEFDYPYIYNRVFILFNEDKFKTDSIFSAFCVVEHKQTQINIPEFIIMDILHLFKPRDKGGLNYGNTLISYRLDFISDQMVGLKKLEYKSKNLNLNTLYTNEPENYFLYNIADVALTVKVNNKLNHINLHNNIRRLTRTNLARSMYGTSTLFDSYYFYKLSQNNSYIRYGIINEKRKSLNKTNIYGIPSKIYNSKIKIDPVEILESKYLKYTNSFKGAYVTDSIKKIINTGYIIDLDATSLYPSKIVESSIAFDTFEYYIIDPIIYNFIKVLFNKNTNVDNLSNSILESIGKAVDEGRFKVKDSGKTEGIKEIYTIVMYLINKIIESNISFESIINPETLKERIYLTAYLIPLINICVNLAKNKKYYNTFVFDLLYDDINTLNKKYPVLYVIENPFSPSKKILKMTVSEVINIKNKGTGRNLTITGAIFRIVHNNDESIIIQLIHDLWKMRKDFNNEIAKIQKERENIKDQNILNEIDNKIRAYNDAQESAKRINNSSYGVLGLSTYRYSNVYIANAITAQGILTLSISQQIVEDGIHENFYNKTDFNHILNYK